MSKATGKAIKEILNPQDNPPQEKELSAVELAMIEVMEMLDRYARARALKKGLN